MPSVALIRERIISSIEKISRDFQAMINLFHSLQGVGSHAVGAGSHRPLEGRVASICVC